MTTKPLILSALIVGFAGSALAQTLNMPRAEHMGNDVPYTDPATLEPDTGQRPGASPAATAPAAPKAFTITLPGRGMTMSQVEEKFGPPNVKHPEVGEPPIIRWDYDTFSVYFEYQFVISAVAHAAVR